MSHEPDRFHGARHIPSIAFAAILVAAVLSVSILAAARFWQPDLAPPQPTFRDIPPEPELIAQGKDLFLSACAYCHLNPDGSLGAQEVQHLPSWAGTIYTPNISRDILYGTGAHSDDDLWNLIAYGLRSDGSQLLQIMPRFAEFNDDQLSALIAFLRYSQTIARPIANPTPDSMITPLGYLYMVMLGASRTAGDRFAPDDALDPGRKIGRVYGCVTCHSPALGNRYAPVAYTGNDWLVPAAPGLRDTPHTMDAQSLTLYLRGTNYHPRNHRTHVPQFGAFRVQEASNWLGYIATLSSGQKSQATHMQQNPPNDNQDCQFCHQHIRRRFSPKKASYMQAHGTAQTEFYRLHAPRFAPTGATQ